MTYSAAHDTEFDSHSHRYCHRYCHKYYHRYCHRYCQVLRDSLFYFWWKCPCTFWTKSRCAAGCATPVCSLSDINNRFSHMSFQMRWLHFWKLPHPVDPVLVGLRTREVGTPFSNYLQVKRNNKFFLNDEHSRCALQGFDSLVVLLFSFSESRLIAVLCTKWSNKCVR